MSRHPRNRTTTAPLPHVAAIYPRVSSIAQDAADKSSLQTQEAGCRAWAAAHGWLVDDALIFRDRHSGEELWERPGLTALREAAKQRRFGLVICHSIDRLSRNPVHLGILLEEFARIGVAVEFVSEALDDSPEAALVRYIRGYAGQVENEKRRERQMRAVAAKVARGQPVGSNRPPYGYVWADSSKTRLAPDAATAWVLQRIFTQYASGTSMRAVAAALMRDAVPTPTARGYKVWTPATIKALLTRPIYWGQPRALCTETVAVRPDERSHYAHKSRIVRRPAEQHILLPATVAPPLVSPALAASCKERMRRNRQLTSATPKHPEAALLRGLARCGVCGGSIHANSRNGGRTARYICRNAIRTAGSAGADHRLCQPHAIAARTVDAVVWQHISNVLTHPDIITHELEQLQDGPAPLAADIAAVDARIASIHKRMDSLMDTAAYATDETARKELAARIDTLAKEKRGCEAERTAVEASIANWHSNYARLDALQRDLDGVAAEIEHWGYQQRRNVLLSLGTRVVLHPADHAPRIELSIRLPVSGRLALGAGKTHSSADGADVSAIRSPAAGVNNPVTLHATPATRQHKPGYCA